eukprot:TRINITY_DN1046_c1_g1_i11.p2 TRINITY_DN1046_c1_g1~~TRINITY_DN1046_c1_g1_i11.p2  ORF type:complete len:208 (+),score=16.87 TRINITY_DN1046_c1_g1_i11:388-1011(+)
MYRGFGSRTIMLMLWTLCIITSASSGQQFRLDSWFEGMCRIGFQQFCDCLQSTEDSQLGQDGEFYDDGSDAPIIENVYEVDSDTMTVPFAEEVTIDEGPQITYSPTKSPDTDDSVIFLKDNTLSTIQLSPQQIVFSNEPDTVSSADNECADKNVCQQPLLMGVCRGYFVRYYYDAVVQDCVQFVFGGCEGNQNNFESYEKCVQCCQR